MDETSSETTESQASEDVETKRPARGKRKASEEKKTAEEGAEDVTKETEQGNTDQGNKKGKGKSKKATTSSEKLDTEGESQESTETSQENEKEADEEDKESEETPSSPPKKRLLKRTLNEAKAGPGKTVKAKNTKSSDQTNKTKGKPLKKGKGALNGSQKGIKRKIDAEEEEEEEEEKEAEENSSETSSPKKRRFNLEKDAVPAPKFGKGKK